MKTAILVVVVACASSTLNAQWSGDPAINTDIITTVGIQENPVSIPDGRGGAIVAWEDTRSGERDIYAQRISSTGYRMWGADGIPVCTAVDTQKNPKITPDESGGVIIVWEDKRNGNFDVFSQRIDSGGTILWALNGVAVCEVTSLQRWILSASDGDGGAIVVWTDDRGLATDIYGQRIGWDGVTMWASTGLPISTAPGAQNLDRAKNIISDGSGGVIVAWNDGRDPAGIYAQRVDGSGGGYWTTDGLLVSDVVGGIFPSLVPDGSGGVIIAWATNGGSGTAIRCQRVAGTGSIAWGGGSVLVADAALDQHHPFACSDGEDGVIISWWDFRNGSDWDIYSQRVDSAGAVRWSVDGVPVSTGINNAVNPLLVPDDKGGTIVCWDDDGPPDQNIFCQRLDPNGNRLWLPGGNSVTTNAAFQVLSSTVPDGSGGILVFWADARGINPHDIFAQRLLPNGVLPPPGTVSGVKFSDADDDSRWDGSETLLPDWKIYLKDPLFTLLDSTTTDSAGNYSFILPDGSYVIDEEVQSGWTKTFPQTPPYHQVTIDAGSIHPGIDFGNVFQFNYVGSSGGAWSDSSNWQGNVTPGPTNAVVIPDGVEVVVDHLPSDSVLSLRVRANGKLLFTDAVGQLRVAGRVVSSEGSILEFPAGIDSGGLICYSDFTDSGIFIRGESTLEFAGNRKKNIVTMPSLSGGPVFYNLRVNGESTYVSGSFSVENTLYLGRDLTLRTVDTVQILNDSGGAIAGEGIIPAGTLIRKIRQSSQAVYRFESDGSFIQFDSTGDYPDAIAVTTYPDAAEIVDTFFGEIVPGTHDTVQNTIVGDSVDKFSKWAIGRPIPRLTGIGGSVVKRLYSIDAAGGSGFKARLSLRYRDSELPTASAESSLVLLRGFFVFDSMKPSWNLVSVPVRPVVPLSDSIYPTAVSGVFSFDPDSGYQSRDSLQQGIGYWVKFAGSTEVGVLGEDVERDTITLKQGWNLIGTLTRPVEYLTTVPEGVLSGPIYSYGPGYSIADTLRPGRGYWVRADTSGLLVLDDNHFLPTVKISSDALRFDDLNQIEFDGPDGFSQKLYFAVTDNPDTIGCLLPPVPPAGVPDVRFTRDTFVQWVPSAGDHEYPIELSSVNFPLTIKWNVAGGMSNAFLSFDSELVRLAGQGSYVVRDRVTSASLLISGVPALPRTFSLGQNYPNPFNPRTRIDYDLPVECRVSLRIYNLLGQLVANVVERVQRAGRQSVEWNAANYPSGVYFYKLDASGVAGQASTFTQVKKLILLR